MVALLGSMCYCHRQGLKAEWFVCLLLGDDEVAVVLHEPDAVAWEGVAAVL